MTSSPSLQTSAHKPVWLFDLELNQPIQDIGQTLDSHGQPYTHAYILVRVHTIPIGQIDVTFEQYTLSADKLVKAVWNNLANQINHHLQADGLPQITSLTPDGLSAVASGQPACQIARSKVLSNAPFITVAICTRERAQKLDGCLAQILELDYPNYEILVIDNAPKTNGTYDVWANKYRDNDHLPVRYAREDRPGLSWARNCGLLHAKGEIVLYIDDDELVDKYLLAEIATGFQSTDNVGCVTGLILPAEIETQAQAWFEQFGGATKNRDFTPMIFNMTTHRRQNPMFPTPPFGSGGNMAFLVSALKKVGGFDNALGAGTPAIGAEDTSIFTEILLGGYTLVIQPTAFVRHFHYREYEGLKKQLSGYSIGLTAYYTRTLLANPFRLFLMLQIVPRSINYMLNPKSARTATMQSDYPKELDKLQRSGLSKGPMAYWRSLQHIRKMKKQFGPVSTTPVVNRPFPDAEGFKSTEPTD